MSLRVVAYTTNSWVSPLAHLRLVGPIERAGMVLIRGNENDRIWPERVKQADLIVIQRDFPRHQKAYREIIGRARSANKPVIFELDDLVFTLPEQHPDRIQGYYAEALLPMLDAAMEADAVTVSTQPLADYLRLFNSSVFVLPNMLDKIFWKMKTPRISNGEKLQIGYMGGPSHGADLQIITPVLLHIAQRYGEKVAFRFVGMEPPQDLIKNAETSWEPVSTMDYAQFAIELHAEEFDIVLAPLADNAFNRAKSSIKFLEYSAIGVPGVFSNLPPYADLITDGQEGFLATTVDEWAARLSELIDKPDLRLRIVQKAQQKANNFSLNQHANRWLDVYEQVAKGSRSEQNDLKVVLEPIIDQIQTHFRTLADQKHLDRLRLAIAKIRLQQEEIIQLKLDRDSFSKQLWQVQHDRLWLRMQSLRAWKTRLLKRDRDLIASQKALVVPVVQNASSTSDVEHDSQLRSENLDFVGSFTFRKSQASRLDVFLFAVMDWETRIQRPQQIARQFALAGYRVFYFCTSFHQGQNLLVSQLEENIWSIHLSSQMPVNLFRDPMDPALRDHILADLESLRSAFGISNAISMVDLPFWWPLVQVLRANNDWPIIYDCMDYHQGFSTNHPNMLAYEDILIKESDLVLTTSHFLQRQVDVLNPNNLLVPNAAEFEHFFFQLQDRPDELLGVDEPIIGYFGAIADWFDTKLLRTLALARPHWSFILIGSTLYADRTPLDGVGNIHLLGEKPYSDLPRYLHSFDIAIIPFKKIPLTDATNPVKLFEYLSAGKPVVATNLDELQYYADQVHLAEDSRAWLSALDLALTENKPDQIRARQAFARQNTWPKRFAQIEPEILALFSSVSVIVLTYNNLEYTRLCLQSILEKTNYPSFELVVVDNHSSDGTPKYLQELAARDVRVKIRLNDENVGFAAGNNMGTQMASGEILVFLNNDTIVTPEWMSALVKHLQNPSIGMVGPVTNWSGNETRIEVPYQSIREIDQFASAYTTAYRGKSFEISMLPFMCVAIRKNVFDQIGFLDEQFGIGMFEDDDYARRVRAKGYQIICAEDVFIHHWGSASFSKLADDTYRQLFEENRRKLEAKWGIQWNPHESRYE